MDNKTGLMTLVILAALFLTLIMAGLLLIFIFHIDGFTIPAQYYEAYRDESPRDHPDVVSARYLTEEDMTAHPALSALIIQRKRVVVSRDPRQVLSLAREWNRYSWMPVSPDDDAFLFAVQDRIVWYQGKTYYIERPVGIPSGEKCGRGTQC